MIRSAIKASLKKVFGVEVKGPAAAPPPPAWKPSVPKPAILRPVTEAPKVEVAAATPAVTQPVEEAAPPSAVPEAVAAQPAVEATPTEAPKAKKGKKAKDVAVEAAAAEPVIAPVVEAQAPPADDTVGAPAFSTEQVQELLDEMVRPALQGDGGDITLIRIESNDVYVKLVGSCSSCPSSIMTMKLGVEALMREELPGFGNLIQVD